jgi:hypothetical protein
MRAHEREALLDVERKRSSTPRTIESVEALDYMVGGDLLASRCDLDVRSGTVTVEVRTGVGTLFRGRRPIRRDWLIGFVLLGAFLRVRLRRLWWLRRRFLVIGKIATES